MKIITKKQNNSRLCFVCGLENNKGLQAEFFETSDNELICLFTADEMHQSYPGRVHGGIAATILDELIGRVIEVIEPNVFGVTTDLQTRYKNPLPLDVQLKGVARITRNTRRIYEADGEIYTPDGQVAVSAHGKYLKMPVEKISPEFDLNNDWFLNKTDNDPTEIDL